MNEDEKHFYKRDWSLEDWKTSEDRLDREVWFAVIQSPHNLWKVRVSLETLIIQAKEEGKKEGVKEVLDAKIKVLAIEREREIREEAVKAYIRWEYNRSIALGAYHSSTYMTEEQASAYYADYIKTLSPNKSDGGKE